MTRRAPLLLLLLLAAAPAAAEDPPSFALTTDTPQYCAQLAKQVGDRHSTIADVKRLLGEGHDMCDRGEIRGGIRRLRRALVILHHRKPPKDNGAASQAAKSGTAKEQPSKDQPTKAGPVIAPPPKAAAETSLPAATPPPQP
jgi:hypothetical protein